jgi:hypothetical protein
MVSIRKVDWIKLVVQVSWLTLLLGAGLEVIIYFLDLALGQATSLIDFALGLIKKLAWTLPLCLVLALVMQRSLMMGLAGLLAAPVATLFSSLFESQLREMFLNVVTEPLSSSLIQSALFRGLEYGLLGAVIGYLNERQRKDLLSYALAGFGVGVIFGSLVIYRQWQSEGHLELIGNLTELLFPLGCAVILNLVDPD